MATIVVFKVNIKYMNEVIDELLVYSSKHAQEACFSLVEEMLFHMNNNIEMKSTAFYCPTFVINSDTCLRNLKHVYSPINMVQYGKTRLMEPDFRDEKYNSSLSNLISHPQKKVIVSMNGYAVSSFIQCLTKSREYLELVTDYISNICHMLWNSYHGINIGVLELQIDLQEPDRHLMDLKWAKMACTAIQEKRHLQYALSWLSTLGGAFSALGEQQERCAINAGKISIEQLRLAMKLGDAIIITQCKLYFSLSLIQRGRCKSARKIIEEEYNKLKTRYAFEKKTLNMCKGIWARLKYEIHRRRLARKKNSNLFKEKTIS